VTWKQRAEQARELGYPRGNGMELEYETWLKVNRPDLVKELGADLKWFIETKVSEAFDMAERLESQGTPPDISMEMARADLLRAG
jgi:hypothetical protein